MLKPFIPLVIDALNVTFRVLFSYAIIMLGLMTTAIDCVLIIMTILGITDFDIGMSKLTIGVLNAVCLYVIIAVYFYFRDDDYLDDYDFY